MRYDPASDTYFVASGWGEKSDWFRNIQAHPEVEVLVGRRRFRAIAVRLPLLEAEREVQDYARRSPAVARMAARLSGLQVDGTEEGYRALVPHVPIIAFCPRDTAQANRGGHA